MSCTRWMAIWLYSAIFALAVSLTGCKSQPQPAHTQEVSSQSQAPKTTDSLNENESAGPSYALKLPANFDRRTGDWDEIKKSGVLRLLVLYNKTGFFYDKGRPRGVVPDTADELEVYLNKKLKTGAKKFKVVFIPVTPAELEKDLNEGYGDIIASVVTVTPEREKRVDFSIPIISGLKLVVVSEKNAPQVSSVDDLSGKEIYVNRVSLAYDMLREQNKKFKQAGKPA